MYLEDSGIFLEEKGILVFRISAAYKASHFVQILCITINKNSDLGTCSVILVVCVVLLYASRFPFV